MNSHIAEEFVEAAWQNEIEIIEDLAARYPDLIDPAKPYLAQALHMACTSCQQQSAKLLVEKYGADVNAIEDGLTPLHVAVNGCDRETALMLLSNGARGDIRNSEGETALDMARAGGKHMASVVRFLEKQSVQPARQAKKPPRP